MVDKIMGMTLTLLLMFYFYIPVPIIWLEFLKWHVKVSGLMSFPM